jgi:hypothetical protein
VCLGVIRRHLALCLCAASASNACMDVGREQGYLRLERESSLQRLVSYFGQTLEDPCLR